MKTGILLVNLGTPDSTSNGDVRKYLRQFLMDRRVIDINPVGRWFLINLIIAPFRGPKSAKLYREIWTKDGSPLLLHGLDLKRELQKELGENYVVAFGMRYQNPTLQSALDELRKAMVSNIVVVPLYPQYASSSSGSSVEAVMKIMAEWEVTPEVRILGPFFRHPAFQRALKSAASEYDYKNYDHVLFSFHSIPQRHVTKSDAHYGDGKCAFGSCCETPTVGNQYCYRANCVQTANQLASELGIPKEKYSISFQSRLGRDPWLQPYSDHVVEELGKKGIKKLLVYSPAFVADCLETIHEIGTEYEELFQEHGGEKIQLVPSLNSRPEWVQALKEIIGA
jgi:protoporphyrin/coproporphyrin ferrochelatase